MRYRIVDRHRLAAALQRALEKGYGGKQNPAAKAIGLQQSQLSRLIGEKTGELAETTLERLLELVPPAEHPDVWFALVSPEADRLLSQGYEPWLRERLTRYYFSKEPRWAGSSSGIQPHAPTSTGALRALEPRNMELQFWIGIALTDLPDLMTPFEAFAEKRGHERDRVRLAYTRIFEPLLAGRDSAFVERRGEELSPAEFRAFVEAGLRRERILLDRPAAVVRAQQAADSDPATLAEPNFVARSIGRVRLPRASVKAAKKGRRAK